MTASVKFFMLQIFFAVNIRNSYLCPLEEDAKAAYKSGEMLDQGTPITLDKIKSKLRESEIFDWKDPSLTDREKKELSKLFDAIEIMTTSRNRQPVAVQNVFSAMRLVERAVKKQLKEGQISETLAAKFHWDKMASNCGTSGFMYLPKHDKYRNKSTNICYPGTEPSPPDQPVSDGTSRFTIWTKLPI